MIQQPCGQYPAYDGLYAPRLEVNVTDNDQSGVIVTKPAVNTTINNFGDSLTSATYGIKLMSQPVAMVAMALEVEEGEGWEFTETSTDFSVWQPEDWNTTYKIEVSTTAATNKRPACGRQRMRCDDLRPRVNVLAHTVRSDDPNYESAAATDVKVFTSVVYDPTPPPEKVTSKFVDLLNGLMVTFDQHTDRAELSGSFDCHEVLNLTAAPASLFGDGASCSWPASDLLKVTFGTNPTVVPGDLLVLKEYTVQVR